MADIEQKGPIGRATVLGDLLTLAEVATAPRSLAHKIALSDGRKVFFRPLEPSDSEALASFLKNLSPKTRELSTFPSFDEVTAQEMCDAINRYDKLRLIVTSSFSAVDRIVALFEFSFDLAEDDCARYRDYGIDLVNETDCRFGPTIADDFQDLGLGSDCLPLLIQIAQRFGQNRIILLGGVLSYNTRAIHFYEKYGFRRAGKFAGPEGKEFVDMILDISQETVLTN